MCKLTNGAQCQVQIPDINYPSLQSTHPELFTKKLSLEKKTIFLLQIVMKILHHSASTGFLKKYCCMFKHNLVKANFKIPSESCLTKVIVKMSISKAHILFEEAVSSTNGFRLLNCTVQCFALHDKKFDSQ